MELNRLPKVANVLVFQDHFTKHVIAYVTPDQWVSSIRSTSQSLGAPARLLSDWGANFTSNIIDKMFNVLSMRKLWTTPYHPQMNGLVERSHQTIM